MIPKILRYLFILHFIIDYAVAVPLMIAPVKTLSLLGWNSPEIVATRLTAAALMGIGGISFIARNSDPGTYRHMLTMKLLWSGSAILALMISIAEGAPLATFIFLLTFSVFFCIWLFYRLKL